MFEGLDLAAAVHLNGKEVGTHANAFYPCRLDVTASLVKGTNSLVVKLDSGLFHAMDRSADGYAVNPGSRLTKHPWLRKVQSSHGWDWSSRLLNVGIHGAVRLEIADAFRFDQASVLATVSEDGALGTVTAHLIHGLKNPLAGLHSYMKSRGDGRTGSDEEADWAGLASSKAVPISDKASVSDEAANTVRVPCRPGAPGETPAQPARIAHESANWRTRLTSPSLH